ncbi:MAG: DUF1646 domain-containing protein [Elusimicrobiota bacterium]|jgi:predicted cation transporter|nr:DUF1646 domain-containing protein [Elusimicrobiota bacterium]
MSLTVMVLLSVIILLALFVPFLSHKVEQELEAFLFVLGVAAVSITGAWSWELIKHALKEPIAISLAVLITGLLFSKFKDKIVNLITFFEKKFGLKTTVFFIVFFLGLISSVITAIIAALVLCEIIAALRLNRKDTVHIIVMGCFAIGMGAVLTPLGEPLSTIVTGKLRGAPHYAHFFFLFNLLWKLIIPGLLAFSMLAVRIDGNQHNDELALMPVESAKDLAIRAGKVFLFVMALVFFGKGLTPLAEATIMKLPSWALFWANSISAILDNATLAAAEIAPAMTNSQLVYILTALIVSGGFLIPGNIPNIICAAKFKIKSKEWAKAALPCGITIMLIYFVILSII